MSHRSRLLALAGLAAAGALTLAPANVSAASTAATATISLGTFGFVTGSPAATVSFAATLTGLDQTTTATLPLDVSDATGSGAGWNVTATSTQFLVAGHTLPTTATKVTGTPASACDTNSTCTLATNAITYPYTLPAAAVTAPTATKLWNAALNTGMGNQTVTPTFTVSIPSSTFAGAYLSTWTISLVSAP